MLKPVSERAILAQIYRFTTSTANGKLTSQSNFEVKNKCVQCNLYIGYFQCDADLLTTTENNFTVGSRTSRVMRVR